MIDKRFNLKLYTDYPNEVQTPIFFYQGDEKTGFIDIELFERTTPIDLTDVSYCEIIFKKSDGNITHSKTNELQARLIITDILNGKLTYQLGTQDISTVGLVHATLSLNGTSGERLTTCNFQMNVLQYLDNDAQSTTSTSINSFNSRISYLESQVTPQYPKFYDLVSTANLDSGIVTSSTINSITDSTKNWIVNQFVNKVVKVYNGNYDYGLILSNTTNTIVFDSNFTLLPSVGYNYKIIDAYILNETDMDIMISADTTLNDCALILPQVNSNNNRRTVNMYLEKGGNHFVNICRNVDRQGGYKYGVLLSPSESVTLKSHNYIPNHYDIFSNANIKRYATGYWNATEDIGGVNVYTPIGNLASLIVDDYRRFTPVNKSGKSWMKYNSLFARKMQLTGNYKIIKTGAGDATLDFALIKYDAETGLTTQLLNRVSTVKQSANDIFTVSFRAIIDLKYGDEIAVICRKDTDTFTMQIGSSMELREV